MSYPDVLGIKRVSMEGIECEDVPYLLQVVVSACIRIFGFS